MNDTALILDGIDAVLFDMDGTLIDSMWIWRDIDDEFLSQHGFKNDLLHEDGIEGMSFDETAAYFKEYYNLNESLQEIKDRWNAMAYERYSEIVDFKKGAQEFLEKCLSESKKMAVATSNSRALVEAAGKRLGFNKYFDAVITSDEIIYGKPAPDVYLKAASEISIEPDRCLVFEDLCQGIKAGKAAGMKVCAVDDIYSHAQKDRKKELADYFIDDYFDII